MSELSNEISLQCGLTRVLKDRYTVLRGTIGCKQLKKFQIRTGPSNRVKKEYSRNI